MDIFIHDVSLIVIMDEDGKTLKGYNVCCPRLTIHLTTLLLDRAHLTMLASAPQPLRRSLSVRETLSPTMLHLSAHWDVVRHVDFPRWA